MGKSAMVICAHSDDQILGAGGTIAKLSKEGYDVRTLIFSYGEGSHPWLQRKYTVEMRVKEALDADKVVGGNGVIFFGLKEGNFHGEGKDKKVPEKIKKLIMSIKPNKILTHSNEDPHPDHRAVQNIVLDVVKKMKYKGNVYAFDIWNPVSMRARRKPKMYVDISDTFRKKRDALRCFESQTMAMILLLWSVYVKAFKNGLFIKKLFAEKFYKIY